MALFGTDGVRGIANTDLSCDIAFKLGQAAVKFLGQNIVIGRDTRRSGDMLEAAVVAGVTGKGGTALLAGIIPTPAIALLIRALHADGGIVISASHNPPEYNGIKLFDSCGYKPKIALEEEVEKFVMQGGASGQDLPTGEAVGISLAVENPRDRYIDHVVKTVLDQGVDFKGLKIALDAGHGAAALTSAEALVRLGAEVVVINDDFNGMDINVDCGSTHLEPLHELMEKVDADIGIAHDGDADRVMLVSSKGREIDGDVVLAVCASYLQKQGKLPQDKVVSTVMCNLGFVHAMKNAGIEVVQTQVGDRHVLEAMCEQGLILGGEQSGHTIFLEHNSTGDGLLTACQFLVACVKQGKTSDEAAEIMQPFPQKLINVEVDDKSALEKDPTVQAVIKEAEEKLGQTGRILVRPSGTEPLIRVMVEAQDAEVAESIANRVAGTIKQLL